jgi:antitoxin (DNA-binding transcriptional repressor) of toxin-antitoxin stability system
VPAIPNYNLTMNRVNIHEAKAQLSRILAETPPGETVLICRRNVPLAELRVLPRPPRGRRRLGLARGKGKVPAAFFEPLPDEIVAAFRGERA